MLLSVNPALQSLIPPLSDAVFDALHASLCNEGCRDAIVVGRLPSGDEWIIDGHNRYRICRAEGIAFEVRRLDFESVAAIKVWMLANQRSRRNLTPDQDLLLALHNGDSLGRFSSLKVNKAKALIDEAPDLATRVLDGTLGVEAAWNLLSSRQGKRRAASRASARSKGRIHIVVGDTQVKPDVLTVHLGWIGRYIVDQFAGEDVAIVHLGDHWDMPSLSSYDKGKKALEGRRYVEDIRAGNDAFALLNQPIADAMARNSRWKPERHFLFGNHEERIVRACNDTAVLDGKISLEDCNTLGWNRHAFREVLSLDGIDYSHYSYHPNTGKPYSGENLLPRLKTIGRSFTMGHQQGLMYTLRPVGLKRQHGLVLGSTYLHDEEYLGPQTTAYWRGIVVCHNVEEGQYDPMFVSLDYLCRRYAKQPLVDFMKEKKAA